MAKETSVQTRILKYLNELPNSFWVKPTTTNCAGCPDIFGVLQGYAIFIEVKRSERETPSEIQKYRIERITGTGALVFVAYDVKTVRDRISEFAERKGILLNSSI
jgi:Holliday junction resolvase